MELARCSAAEADTGPAERRAPVTSLNLEDAGLVLVRICVDSV